MPKNHCEVTMTEPQIGKTTDLVYALASGRATDSLDRAGKRVLPLSAPKLKFFRTVRFQKGPGKVSELKSVLPKGSADFMLSR